ncbi:polymorphic toxin type 44 domain-containing protein [Bradyrhizobium sp. dw_411]|uniref:polymorphic toxin type 44 domain-containing protein n=1 Tax=Bradyrhizobium sp. dw_411 TaxID=2720082 RepID=UPI001BCECAD2|nr:polymorphic toxin type 44 domain-containing protein [Bradyrhizobium sp. dw_411]
MYDAFGNFEYGATGAAAGYSNRTLTGMGDLLHGGTNNPINTQDITSGANAINNGGTLSTIDSSQIGNVAANANSNGGNTGQVGSGGGGK